MTERKHGDRLGDGERWCGTCQKPVDARPGGLDHIFMFGGKTCPECKTVWPEHEAEFLADFQIPPDWTWPGKDT
jgi:hypothetical protein